MFRRLGFTQRAEKDTNLLERRLAELHKGAIPHSVMFQANRALQYSVGHVVEQLVEALRYNPEGREFDS